jgi:hypothetical protein
MVCSVQTVHLSCTDTNTISKGTKTKFHTTHVTCEFHQVHPKLFMSLWYIQFKPCTYLMSRSAISPNGPNRAPPDPRHLGVPSGVSKTIYEPMVRLTQNRAPILHRRWHCLKADGNEIPHDSRHLEVPSWASNTIYEPMVRSTQTMHQYCIKSSTISKRTEPSFHLRLVT